jgi:hypothetical protein
VWQGAQRREQCTWQSKQAEHLADAVRARLLLSGERSPVPDGPLLEQLLPAIGLFQQSNDRWNLENQRL